MNLMRREKKKDEPNVNSSLKDLTFPMNSMKKESEKRYCLGVGGSDREFENDDDCFLPLWRTRDVIRRGELNEMTIGIF